MKKTRMRILSAMLIASMSIAGLVACSKKENANSSSSGGGSQSSGDADIVIGTANGSLCLAPLHIAIDNGYFEEEFKDKFFNE